jgi:hypothetical protein
LDTTFLEVPGWGSWENQGGGAAVADLDGDGRPELIVFRLDNAKERNRGFYRVGRTLAQTGAVGGGWGPWLEVPGWFSWQNQGSDIAVADLDGDGRPELVVFQVDNATGQNRGVYRVGRTLNEAGEVTGGWGPWVDVPDWWSWENQGAAVAVADLDGNGRPDLIVLRVDNPVGANGAYYRVGRGLDRNGTVTGGWGPWINIPDWTFHENQGAGIACADLDGDGRPELVVFAVDNPAGGNRGLYQIGWNVSPAGVVTQGWSDWTALTGWSFWENQGAGIALADIAGTGRPELVVSVVDAPAGANRGFYRVLDLAVDRDAAPQRGVWRLENENSRSLAVHAAALHTNEVLFFSGSSNNPANVGTPNRGVRWNHQTHTLTDAAVPVDMFCAGHALLADGRLLVAGGTKEYNTGHPFFGLKDTWVFQPQPPKWTRFPDMAEGRWYPTLVTLRDGRVAAFSGLRGDGQLNLVPEIWDGAHWTKLPDQAKWSATPPGLSRRIPMYAHLFLLADGRLFYSGACYGGNQELTPCLLDLSAHSFTAVPGLATHEEQNHRNQAASVLLPPVQDQRVMLIGGGAPADHHTSEALDKVNIADLKAAAPKYAPAAPLHKARMHHVAVLLPDRTVLVAGGSRMEESRPQAAREAEIYDPVAKTWTLGARARVTRLYHSVAALLPDGTVITAGSNPERGDEEYRLERYYPPYLFRGPRPVIEAVPAVLHRGESVTITCAQAATVKWVNLTRAGTSTHCLDADQRLVDVPFVHTSDTTLTATVPTSAGVAPPGYYMLTVTDTAGVPSIARWTQLP